MNKPVIVSLLTIQLLLILALTHPAQAAWSFKTNSKGLCSTQTRFEFKRENYQLRIFEVAGHNLSLSFVRQHRRYVPGISTLDALLVTYPNGKIVDLSKLLKFNIQSTREQDIISTTLNRPAIEHLSHGYTLTIEYTINRTETFSHDVDLKYLAENIREIQQCRKKLKQVKSARTDQWRFNKNSAALELRCFAEIAARGKNRQHRLLYIDQTSGKGFIFFDQDRAEGEVDNINHISLTDTKKQIHHMKVDGEFWELNGKSAFYIPLSASQLKLIGRGQSLALNYATTKHPSVEQVFLLRGFGSASSQVKRCR